MIGTRALAVLQALFVGGIAACLFVIATRHPYAIDLTPDRRFTLSPHTHEVLERLTDDVQLTIFYSSQEGALRRELADLLALYTQASPRVRLKMLDLDRSPGAADRLAVTTYNTGVAEAGDRRARIDQVSEEGVTDALLQVAGLPPVPTCFVAGHGEVDPRSDDERRGGSAAVRALVPEGFETLAVDDATQVPPDASLVIVAGPTRDLAAAEIESLRSRLQHGGGLLLMVDPRHPGALDALLAPLGIEVGRDVVVDDRSRILGTDGLAARVAYLDESLVPNAPEVKAVLPVAQSLRMLDRPGVKGDYLAVSGESTWADVDRRVLDDPSAPFRPGTDRRGPLPLAIFARIEAPAGRLPGRLAVIGDADFATNLYLGLAGNRDLLLALAGLAGRDVALGAARPPGTPGGTFSPLVLTAREGTAILWLAVILPAAVLAAGAAVTALRLRHG